MEIVGTAYRDKKLGEIDRTRDWYHAIWEPYLNSPVPKTHNNNNKHVAAHQDNNTEYQLLSRLSELNCLMDKVSKRILWLLNGNEFPPQ